MPAGHPNPDLIAMARPEIRTKLRSAIQLARQKNGRVVVPGGRIGKGDDVRSFSIAVHPVPGDDDSLLLVCFIDERDPVGEPDRPVRAEDRSKVTLLEREIETTRAALHGAIQDLERSIDEQKVINDEALSVNEEYQSTNEELVTSKEELQSSTRSSRPSIPSSRKRWNSSGRPPTTCRTSWRARTSLRSFSTSISTSGSSLRRPSFCFASSRATSAGRSSTSTLWSTTGSCFPTPVRCWRRAFRIERTVRSEARAWYVRRILPYRSTAGDVEGVVVTYVDVTERRRAEEQLLASQRMEAVGQLTGGVAHDFNNLLTVIIINLEQLDEETLTEEARERLLHPAMHAAHRGAELTRHLLSFGGRQSLLPVPTALDQLLPKLREMMTRTLGETIALDLVLAPDLGPCLVDPGQLEIAILNLALNARDAMPKGGRIAIEAKNVTIEARRCGSVRGFPTGDTSRSRCRTRAPA